MTGVVIEICIKYPRGELELELTLLICAGAYGGNIFGGAFGNK
jgi:hypothetical protein